MKAIIVDDEKHVREAIKLLVPWQQFGITELMEAQDGADAAKQIALHRPELIFTDMMMPQKSGVELLDWLQKNYPGGKTIVISGHDDFELLRHTIKAGSVDYILKPIDAEQLLSAVSKAVEQWEQEESERQRQTERNIERNQFKPVYWEKMLSNFISEPAGYDNHAEALTKEFGLHPGITDCQVAILSLDTMSTQLKDKFAANKDLLFFSLVNVANELLTEDGSRQGIAYRYWNSENEIILLLYGPRASTQELLLKIQKAIQAVFHSTLDIGVSLAAPFPYGLPNAYSEARKALRSRNLLSSHKEIYTYEATPSPAATGKLLSFTDFSENVYMALRSGNSEQIKKSLEAWIEAVRELPAITIEQLELWRYEYNVVRSRWLADMFGDQAPPPDQSGTPFVIPLNSEGTLSIDLWKEQLERNLLDLSKRLLAYQHQDSNVIFDIAKYIQNHYHQDITLQDIANHFYLSREYISRKFKQEFQVNLSDYISGIRIDKAKLLLLNPHLKISQVAEMVGYDDEKYFSKVFKKMVGLSPNEYRKVNH